MSRFGTNVVHVMEMVEKCSRNSPDHQLSYALNTGLGVGPR